MENLLKEELLLLFEKYKNQKNGEYDGNDYEYYLEYELLGFAKVVKSISYKVNNMELLGLASKIEIEVNQDIEDGISASEKYYEELSNESQLHENIRQFCIQVFFKDNRYKVDMKKYKRMIEENSESLKKSGVFDSIMRYVDEEKVLKKIYLNVRDSLIYRERQEIPNSTEVDYAFEKELKEIYRKADSYVNHQIEKASQLTSRGSWTRENPRTSA